MKKYFILLLCFSLNFSFAQYVEMGCGMGAPDPESPPTSQGNCNHRRTAFPGLDLNVIPAGNAPKLKINVNLIWLQKSDGTAGWDRNNSSHTALFDAVFQDLNDRLANLIDNSCPCGRTPPFQSDAKMEFIPNYVDVANTFYWNDRNDPDPGTLNSGNKSFLNEIVNLASNEPEFINDAFNVVFTVGGPDLERFIADPSIPIWEYGEPTYYLLVNGEKREVAYSSFPVTSDLNE